jgi:ABC-2 type transport system permease protein
MIATLLNEWRLLIRDPAGFLVLFLMPALLVVVVSLVQMNVLASVSDRPAVMLFVNLDDGDLGERLRAALEDTAQIRPVDTLPGGVLTAASGRAAVAAGDYQVCLVVPAGLSADIRDRARQAAAAMLRGSAPAAGKQEKSIVLRLYFDPLAGGAYRAAVSLAVRNVISGIETRERLKALANRLPGALSDALASELGPAAGRLETALADFRLEWPDKSLVTLERHATGRGRFHRLPTAVQQNVPAWALFGMFFTLVPLAVSLVRERASGVMLRLRILPVPYVSLMAGKLGAYCLVCLAQFGLILIMGRYLMPLLGLPALAMGEAHGALGLVVAAASLAAAGAGVLLGTAARSQTQASTIGALSVVIAAALGGVMVPVFAMPPPMQTLSQASPLAWGLEAILDLFVRGGDLATVWPQILGLAGFAAATLAAAAFLDRRRP